jgi:hypothetical protein
MEVANALAYFDTVTITAVKSFQLQALAVSAIDLFFVVHAEVRISLTVFSV